MQQALDIPGMSVAVARDGQLLWSAGFGFADLEQQVPAGPDTRYRLGSVSKLITAAAMVRLMEAGRLDLDAPVRRYVSSFPEQVSAMTPRQLAGHLAGIRHYAPSDFSGPLPVDFRHFDTVEESLELFSADELVAAPGTIYNYSTFGYTLLGAAMEGAAGLSFLDVIEARVLRPLGLKQTGADDRRRLVPHRSRFYERDADGVIRHASYMDPSYKWAGGGLLSTAEDVVRFGSAHLKPGFLQASTLEMMFTSQVEADGTATGVGLGWHIGEDAAARPIAFHTGVQNGCRAVLLVYREQGVVVAMLSNLTETPLLIRESAQVVAARFLDGAGDAGGFIGEHAVTGTFNDQAISGSLRVESSAGVTGGAMTLGDRVWPVVDVLARDGGYEVALLHPRAGLLPLLLKAEDGSFSGSLRAARHHLEVVVQP